MTAFRDIQPKAKTHILIIPNVLIPTVNDVELDHELALAGCSPARKLASDAGIAEDGYRLIMNCNRHGGTGGLSHPPAPGRWRAPGTPAEPVMRLVLSTGLLLAGLLLGAVPPSGKTCSSPLGSDGAPAQPAAAGPCRRGPARGARIDPGDDTFVLDQLEKGRIAWLAGQDGPSKQVLAAADSRLAWKTVRPSTA